MTAIPFRMVECLDLRINKFNIQYELKNASCNFMEMLGTVVICLEPEGSDTTEVFRIVTDELRDFQILLSYADKMEWGLLNINFP